MPLSEKQTAAIRERISGAPPPEPVDTSPEGLGQLIATEKDRADYVTAIAPRLKASRDSALQKLLVEEGPKYGFHTQDEEDHERFADWLVKEVTEGTFAAPAFREEVKDIYKYEAVNRYGTKQKPAKEPTLVELHRQLRAGHRQGRTRSRQLEQFDQQVTRDVGTLGAPEYTRIPFVVETGELGDEVPGWKKSKAADALKKNLSGLYTGTAVGNVAGLAHDPNYDKYLQAWEQTPVSEIDPEDRPLYRRLYKARAAQKLRRGESVAGKQLIIPQTLHSNGLPTIDLDAMEHFYDYGIRSELAQRAGYSSIIALNQKGTPEEKRRIVEEAKKRASDEVAQVQHQSLNTVLFLKDARKFSKALRKGEDPLAWSSALLTLGKMLKATGAIDEEGYDSIAQFRAPIARVLYPQTIEGMGNGALHYARTAEQLGTGNLDWFFNFGPWQPFFSWALDPRADVEWGSIEHLMRQGKNYNVFHDAEALGEATADFFGFEESSQTAKANAGFAAALLLTLIEPDLFTAMFIAPKLALAPVKASARAAAKAAGVAEISAAGLRTKRAEDATTALVEKLREAQKADTLTVETIFEEIHKLAEQGYIEEAKVIQALESAARGVGAGSSFSIAGPLQALVGEADKVAGTKALTEQRVVRNAIKANKLTFKSAQQEKDAIDLLTNLLAAELKEAEAQVNWIKAAEAIGATSGKSIHATAASLMKKAEANFAKFKEYYGALRKKPKVADKLAKATKAKDKKILAKELAALNRRTDRLRPQVKSAWMEAGVLAAGKELKATQATLLSAREAVKGLPKSKKVTASIKEGAQEIVSRERIVQHTSPKVIDSMIGQVETVRDAYGHLAKHLSKTVEELEDAAKLRQVDLNPFYKVTGDRKTIQFATKKWLDEVRGRFGSDHVDELLQELMINPATRNFRKRLAKDQMDISEAEFDLLKDISRRLAQRAYKEVDAPLDLARGLLRAWQDNLSLRRLSRARPEEILAYIAKRVADFGSKFDAARSRLGPWQDHLQIEAGRHAIRGPDWDYELSEYLIRSGADDPALFGTKIALAMDTTENLKVGPRVASFNKTNGSTPFQNFKSYVIGITSGMTRKEAQEVLSKDPVFRAAALSYLPNNMHTQAAEAGTIYALVYDKVLRSQSWEDLVTGVVKSTLAAFKGKISRETLAGPSGKPIYRILADGEKEVLYPDYIARSMLARAVLAGQNFKITNDNLVRALGPAMTQGAALKANFILSQATSESGRDTFEVLLTSGGLGFDASDAISAIEKWGMTFDKDIMPYVVDRLKSANNLNKDLIRLGEDQMTGAAVYVPHPLKRQLEGELDDAIKALSASPRTGGFDDINKDHLGKWLRLWRTSVTRGLIYPRPGYFMNQGVGDVAQMLMPEGLLSIRRKKGGADKGAIYLSGALPMTFHNAFTYIPGIGPRVAAAIEGMGEAAAKAGVPSLTTPLNAMLNPPVQRILSGRHMDELWETVDGPKSGARLIAEMQENNVFDIMFSKDLREQAGRWAKESQPSKWGAYFSTPKKAWQQWQRTMTELVAQTQNHQRAALYLEHRLRRQSTEEVSRKAVAEALYDWRHGITKWEMDTLAQFAGFYPWTRLAMGQMGNALIEPLTFSAGEATKKAILGTSRLNRARKMGQTVYGFPEWIAWEEGDQELDFAEAVQYTNLKDKPWWSGGRPVIANTVGAEFQRRHLAETGEDVTTMFRVGPSFGTPDTINMYLTLMHGVVGTAATALGSEHLKLTGDAREEIFDELLLDHLNPWYRAFTGALYEKHTEGGGFTYKHPSGGRRAPANLREMARLANKLPFLQELVVADERGYYLNPTAREMLLATPILGNEIPNLMRLYYGANPGWEESMQKGIAYMLGDLSGAARIYVSDPERSRDYIANRIAREAEARRQAYQKQAESEGGPASGLKVYEPEPFK